MRRLFKFSEFVQDLRGYFGYSGADPEEMLRRLVAGFSGSVITPLFFVFGFIHLFKGAPLLGWLLVIGGFVMGTAVVSIPRVKKVIVLIRVVLGYCGCLFVYLLAVSGPTGHTAIWLFIYPLAVFLMLGIREGSLLNALFFIAALLIILLPDSLLNIVPIEPGFSTRFLTSLLIVNFIAFFYENVRTRHQKEIEKRQQNLEAARKEAETANRAKSDFLANMSHELRTPLNHIIGFTELVLDRESGNLKSTQREYLNDVLNSSRHLLALINDLLDLSKVEAGKLQLDLSDVDLEDLLENSLGMVREKALAHAMTMSVDVHGIEKRIRADERKLKQILYNLLSNAVKFTPDGGKVLLRAHPASQIDDRHPEGDSPYVPATAVDGYIEISVQDTGIGIHEDDLHRVFEPFEQAENTVIRKYQGTGLGLSLTRKLVELHGGRIWAESEGENKGSTFKFILPVGTERRVTTEAVGA